MKAEKPKENKCKIVASCFHLENDRCVYASNKNGTRCKYAKGKHIDGYLAPCQSKQAQINAMVLALKDMGFEVELKGGKK